MKTKKLLARLAGFLNADQTAQRKELKSIRKVLKKLKAKERDLTTKLEETPPGDEYEEISQKLQVIYAQRRKGIERVREIKGRNKEQPSP
ncbi:hypothetical protein [Ectothiorhodospira lacustris]|uniref:hypothetical protein n=1 Tax=Ectothiorhodospira lacustris TaxID=2899127 RepID=UPI001EE865BC|nr:hypothetical protein [Ectothiorhodospira lacustris]MCG5500075.1 hypothetical protein [Ectothiorhodospira lacustris]MCG5509429.1 hypothetical protein [Ectothiorhodospira lacustris]MCG5521483.1 hypothetical protein [Ectothiorhodospira lacustris]